MTFCSVLLRCCCAAVCSVRVFDRKLLNVFCTEQHQPCLCAELWELGWLSRGSVRAAPGFKVDSNLCSESTLLLSWGGQRDDGCCCVWMLTVLLAPKYFIKGWKCPVLVLCRRSTYNHLSSWLTDARNLTNPNTVSWTSFSPKARLLLPEQSGRLRPKPCSGLCLCFLHCSCPPLQSAVFTSLLQLEQKGFLWKSSCATHLSGSVWSSWRQNWDEIWTSLDLCYSLLCVSNEVNAVLRLECKLDL